MTLNYVTPEGFPYGLRCSLCDHVIEVGQLYREVPYGMYEDTPIVELAHWENECE